MTISIEPATGHDVIQACRDLMLEAFQNELGFHGMNFPDLYEDHLIYVAIRGAAAKPGCL